MTTTALRVPTTRIGTQPALSVLRALAVLGGVVSVAGIFIEPARGWPSLLLAGFYVVSLSMAGLFFVATQYLAKARWSTAFRSVPGAIAAVLPVPTLLLLAIIVLGAPSIYGWVDAGGHAGDAVMQSKLGWLNLPFFYGRAVFYVAVWIGFAIVMLRHSGQEDLDCDTTPTPRGALPFQHRARSTARCRGIV